MTVIPSILSSRAPSVHSDGATDNEETLIPKNPNVSVCVRLRPPEPNDDVSETFDFPVPERVVSIKDPVSRGRSEHTFQFTEIFSPKDGQGHIFDAVAKPHVDRLLKGFNSCIFAYGQTGSGKTHSIFGHGSGEDRGMLPRTVEYLFQEISQITHHTEVGLVVSFLEVYNDQIRDLGRPYWEARKRKEEEEAAESTENSVASPVKSSPVKSSPQKAATRSGIRTGPGRIRPASAQNNRCTPRIDLDPRPNSASGPDRPGNGDPSDDLEIRESQNGTVYVQGLSLIPVTNIAEIMQVVNCGLSLRATSETKMNPTSSRSHTVFTINVYTRCRAMNMTENRIYSGQLNLIDLAGSERQAKSKSEGQKFHEAVNINASLSALGRVVLSLASNPKTVSHTPYRDSKLTRILQGGLGGNSYTTMLCCINPSSEHYEENLNSLAFADRCKNVENKPMINHVGANKPADKLRIRKLMREIDRLKQEIDASNRGRIWNQEESDRDSNASEGSSDPIGKEQTARLNEVKAMMAAKLKELENQKNITAEMQRKAGDERLLYQKTKEEIEEREAMRQKEITTLEQKQKQEERMIGQVSESFEKAYAFKIAELKERLKEVQEGSKNKANDRDQVLLNIRDVLRDRQNIMQRNKITFEEQLSETKKVHAETIEILKEEHDRQIQREKAKYQEWLLKKEIEAQALEKDKKIEAERFKKELELYRRELVGLYELVTKVSKIIQDMEMGIYPVAYKSDIKCVMLLPHLKPKFLKIGLSEKEWPFLFKVLANIRAKQERYQQHLFRLKFQESGGQMESPEASIPFAGTYEANSATRHPMQGFEASIFLEEFLKKEDDETVKLLSEDQLRDLICALKDSCRHQFDIQAEKKRIRVEVEQELNANATLEYLRHLEAEVEKYKEATQQEAEKAKKLKMELAESVKLMSVPLPELAAECY